MPEIVLLADLVFFVMNDGAETARRGTMSHRRSASFLLVPIAQRERFNGGPGQPQALTALHHQPMRRSSRFQLVRSSALCNGNNCEVSHPEMRTIIPLTALDCTSFHPLALASWPDRDSL